MAFFKKIRSSAENTLDIANASLEGILFDIRKEQMKEQIKAAKYYDKLIKYAEKHCGDDTLHGIDAVNACLEKRNWLIDLMEQIF